MPDSGIGDARSFLDEATHWWGESTATRLVFVVGLVVGTAGLLLLLEPLGWWLSIAGWAIVFLVRWLQAVSSDEGGQPRRAAAIDLLQRITIGILLGGGAGLLILAGRRLADADGGAAVAALAGFVAVVTTAMVLAKGDQRLLGLVFFAVGIAVLLTGSRVLAQVFLAFGVIASGLPQRIRSWVDDQSGR